MKIVTLSPDNPGKSGIETVEKQLLKPLEKHSEIELERVDHQWIKKDFPLSNTIDNILRPIMVSNKIPEDADKVLVPAQTRLTFDPETVEAEIIVYVHDLFPQTHFFKFEEERGPLYRYFFSGIGHVVSSRYMRNLMKVDKILTPTRYIQADVETHTPFSGEVKVVGQGVDHLPEVMERENRDIDLLYVGSTLGRKNPQALKKALGLAVENGFNVVTVSEDDSLPGVNFQNISDKRLANLYSRSRYLISTSYVEGFGRPPVEAQRYGCIPITFRNPVTNEVLPVGKYHPRKVEYVLDILEDPECDTESIRNTARSNAKRWSWENTYDQLMEVILEDETTPKAQRRTQ